MGMASCSCFANRGRGRVQTTDVTVVPQENYRDRARGRDSCAVRTKPVAAFTSRKLAPRGNFHVSGILETSK